MDNYLVSGNELTTDGAAFAGGVLGGFLGTVFVSVLTIIIIYYVLQAIAGWKIFKKAGEKGWKSLIPIYSTYIFFKIVGMKKWFWILLGLAFLTGIVSSLTGFDSDDLQNNTYTGANLFGAVVYCATVIFATVIAIWHYVRLSKAFGHGIGFALGLILLPPVFLMILGFGSSKYNAKLVKSWG